MMSNRATYMAGVMTGAVLVSIAWIIFSWEPKPVEPAGRHSLAYDQCLASGRSITACDAAMRVMAAERERIRKQLEADCEIDIAAAAPTVAAPKREPRNDWIAKYDPFPNEDVVGFVKPSPPTEENPFEKLAGGPLVPSRDPVAKRLCLENVRARISGMSFELSESELARPSAVNSR